MHFVYVIYCLKCLEQTSGYKTQRLTKIMLYIPDLRSPENYKNQLM